MVAIGVTNMVGWCFSCYLTSGYIRFACHYFIFNINLCYIFTEVLLTTANLHDFLGSFSRSAINYNAVAKTTISNIVMAIAVLVTLLFLLPLFYIIHQT